MLQKQGIPLHTVLPANSWAGKRCIIVAGSPALYKFDFTPIKNELTIGVNKTFTYFPATLNYSQDFDFYKYCTTNPKNDPQKLVQTAWKAYTGIKVIAKPSQQTSDLTNGDVYTLNKLTNGVVSKDISVGIYHGTNSGFGATMMAIALGATKIGLLGMEMKIDRCAGKTHCHTGYPHQTLDGYERKFSRWIGEFNTFAPLIASAGVQVFRLDANSALDCFPHTTLEEFLK